MLGSGLGNPDVHDHLNLPIVVAGGAGRLKGGRHIKYAQPTALANVHLTMMNLVGVDLDKFGDSDWHRSRAAAAGFTVGGHRAERRVVRPPPDLLMTCTAVLLFLATFNAAPAAPPLVEAVKNGDGDAVRKLIKERVNVNAAEVDGTTPLHWAARVNDVRRPSFCCAPARRSQRRTAMR